VQLAVKCFAAVMYEIVGKYFGHRVSFLCSAIPLYRIVECHVQLTHDNERFLT